LSAAETALYTNVLLATVKAVKTSIGKIGNDFWLEERQNTGCPQRI
jgi:hypothetical protein